MELPESETSSSFVRVPISYMYCREMATSGECRYGNECKFAHDENAALARLSKIAAERTLAQAKRRGVCHAYASGVDCKFGDSCKFAHVLGEEADDVVKLNETRKQKVLERRVRKRAAESSTKEESIEPYLVPLEWVSFEEWIAPKIKNLPQYESFRALYDRAIDIMISWEKRFASEPKVWSRFVKGGGQRMIKELVESAPVIDRVWNHVQAMESTHTDASTTACPTNPMFERVTIVDLCSGFGFLSMFLSELLPPNRVKKIVMVDNQWSRTQLTAMTATSGYSLEDPVGVNASTTTRDAGQSMAALSLSEVEVDGMGPETSNISGIEEENTARSGNKQYISVDHFTGPNAATWPIPIEASKQDIKSRATLRSMQKIIFDRAVGASNGNDGDGTDGIIIIGVHLCGLLSLRAVDMFNANSSRVSLFILKPCCLPNTGHIKKRGSFALGRHIIPCVEVCAAGKWVGNAVEGAWKGPPRNHLTGRFKAWTKHLMLGIDIASDESGEVLSQCHVCGTAEDEAEAAASDHIVDETNEKTNRREEGDDVIRNVDFASSHSISTAWGSKSVEFFRVQEVGYQNLYIFAQQKKSI
jgi:hypothetical protein